MDEAARQAPAGKPVRIRLSRSAGWRMPAGTVKVDRSTRWGNPFVRCSDGAPMERGTAVALFSGLLEKQGAWWPLPLPWPKGKIPGGPPTTLEDVRRELRGKNLACWCPLDHPCHADVLLRLANLDVDNLPGQAGLTGPA
jgi:hypothetical protein